VRRHAVAQEPGTLVVAVGGWPDRPFEASAWEWWFRAYGLQDLGRLDEARAVMAEGSQERPRTPTSPTTARAWRPWAGIATAPSPSSCAPWRSAGRAARRAIGEQDFAALRADPRWPIVVAPA
jgi:hypothetical protein